MNLFSLGASALLYGLVLPLAVIQMLALLFIPSMMVPGSKPLQIGKAVYCFLLQTLGIVLMSAGGLVALYGVLNQLFVHQDIFSTEVYLALLICFTLGGLTYLWHETMALGIEEPSRRVCAAIFWYTFKTIGFLMTAFSLLAFFSFMLFFGEAGAPSLVLPLLLFLYGALLSFCTRTPAAGMQTYQTTPMVVRPQTVAVPPMQKPVKKATPPMASAKKPMPKAAAKPATKPPVKKSEPPPQVYSV